MTVDPPDFEVLSGAQVRERYRLEGMKAEEVGFDDADVPEPLKHLIPLARVWGVGDDVLRSDMVQAADHQALRDLKRAVAEVEDELDGWLTSPKALATGPSSAYLAFTNLRMAADEVRL